MIKTSTIRKKVLKTLTTSMVLFILGLASLSLPAHSQGVDIRITKKSTLCQKCDNWFISLGEIKDELCKRCTLKESLESIVNAPGFNPNDLDEESKQAWDEIKKNCQDLNILASNPFNRNWEETD
tara:strand:- start:1156 stop:1530 length:375 start_codon:yes stop_codon:yes gene_type:complete